APGARERGDDTGPQVQAAHAPVGDVSDQQPALAVEAGVVRLAQRRLRAGAAVAAVALLAVARDRADEAALAVHFAHHRVEAVNDVQTPLRIDDDRVGLVQCRSGGGAAVAAIALLARAGGGGDPAGAQVDLADAVVERLGDVEV